MKYISIILLFLFISGCNAITGVIGTELVKQNGEVSSTAVTFPETPERRGVKPEALQTAKRDSFLAEHPGWKIRWNSSSQAPAALLGPPIDIGSGSPEQIARSFLRSHWKLLGMRPNLYNLETSNILQTTRTNHVRFQQIHKGVPIEGAIYGINLTKNGELYYVSGSYYDSVTVSTSPSLNLGSAIDQAKQHLGTDLELRGEPEGNLIILPFGKEFRLA